MSLFEKLKKSLSDDADIMLDSADPKFWISTGNYLLNKIISGKYMRGIPQGRITGVTGPSGAGKSFLLANIVKCALDDGFMVLVIDSEKAFDTDYLTAVGADIHGGNYFYTSTNNVDKCAKIFGNMIDEVRDGLKKNPDMKLLIVLDSIDYLFTKQAIEHYVKEKTLANDQGLQAKKHKQLLSTVMQDIGGLPIAVVCTKQVYVDQQAGQNVSPIFQWKMTESIKFAFSQIFLVTRLLDKNKKTNEYDGIRLRVFGFKTRFTKPFQQIELVVPYDTGLDPYEGTLKAAVSLGIVSEGASGWYTFEGNKFQKSGYNEYAPEVLKRLIEKENEFINVEIEGEDDLSEIETATPAAVRASKKKTIAEIVAAKKESEE